MGTGLNCTMIKFHEVTKMHGKNCTNPNLHEGTKLQFCMVVQFRQHPKKYLKYYNILTRNN